MIKAFGLINSDNIKNLEIKYNIKIPEDYKSFILENNGGVISDGNEISVKGLSSKITMDVLFGINTGNSNTDIMYWTDTYKDDLLSSALIIGDDLMQGFIVMICDGENDGIYYWDDAYNHEESNDEGNTYWLADNFTDFYNFV
jgi:hypothetical protein